MKLSISNIAWPYEENNNILDIISSTGLDGVEIAPSRIWNDFREATYSARRKYCKNIENRKLSICSMHSLFWGTANMKIFGEKEERKNAENFLRDLIYLAEDMNIPRMIIGSPAMREKGTLEMDEAFGVATDFFGTLADIACEHGTKLLIEPLSSSETDFITTHLEGIRLVKQIGSKGFGLHLDAKAISSQKEDIEQIFKESINQLEHFHINEKGLGQIGSGNIQHSKIGALLREYKYEGYASIEMKTLPDYYEAIQSSINLIRMEYGNET